MKRIKLTLMIIVFSIVILALLFPYMKAEVLTAKHGEEFNGLQKQTNMLSDARYLRVLSYSHNIAKVFYVSDSGDLLTFEKDGEGNWKYFEWRTIWSESGSASGFLWPYYR